ncbi:fumarylacetoacetate hydrolase family protein [Thalassotalea sp. G2M2-11]|uniref:fumarylacetoacetate hydrolase family protein n=1 Tax=Thalassotalea sp. G2M2-11 TaxID=2787627 RepID=UPI0019CF711D|nr:fumarylacetoacetate hydrolase family protein [Thalassotalea sp. G2M2-11]
MKHVTLAGQAVTPSKIVCIGRNYVDHIAELGNEIPNEMVVFNKPNSAISTQLFAVHHEPLHYEAEICFLVNNGQFCAVGFGLDLTKRALQSRLKQKGLPWERAKAFDGSAVFSDFVAIKQSDINEQLQLRLLIDDVERQKGGVQQMMYKPGIILDELSLYTHLDDGDIVMTGTPKGVGQIESGTTFIGMIMLGDQVLVSQTWHVE